MTIAVRLQSSVETPVGITHYVTVPLQHEVYTAARRYASEQGIKLEVALAESARAYFGPFE